MTPEERVRYLRERGVEVDVVYDKSGAKRPPRRGEGGKRVVYVAIPADATKAIEEQVAVLDEADEGDALKAYAASFFADSTTLDRDVVEREARGQAMTSTQTLAQPSTETLQRLANAEGRAEAYPLARGTAEHRFEAVNLYVDEVGVLRKRPRNARAERFAEEVAGLAGLAIHGDAYVGRTVVNAKGALESVDFTKRELAPSEPWALRARRDHAVKHEQQHHGMKAGVHETYSWSQTADDVEVRVRIPSELGRLTTKRVKLSFPSNGLRLAVDGLPVFTLPKLFDAVAPDDAVWSFDDDDRGHVVVVSLEKPQSREWPVLHLDEPSAASKEGGVFI